MSGQPTREQTVSDTVGAGVTPLGQVAVVVVLYNSASLIPGLVRSLGEGMAGLAWHLIAVDNASTDGGPALLRELSPEATVVETGRNAGYAAGINVGVASAPPHAAVLILNPDVRLTPGCVAELLRAVREPGIGIAVPRLVDAEGELILSMRREPTLRRAFADAVLGASRVGRYPTLGEVVTSPHEYEVETVTDWAEGSTQLVSADCWAACGPWDESFFLYSEETDFDLRARDAGFSTRYVPTARAVHLEGGSGASPGLRAMMAVNRVRLFRRRNGRVRGGAYWFSILLREASRAAIGDRGSHPTVRALTNPRRFRDVPGPHWL
ncbi:MAG: glycosyltransferase family 2 protein [Intrasporangium sp.]|uniref:glycosyltransferase family 2 protein n=1 Tax=Intrasporangium sp. TaxID=1925024 RepID=UPI002649B27F|nr:glycosyltransferase family 2 protein [Intrasporangium sp.]MDN5795495.1 glycosyltransferase family 2 protein [Intrasporangium sp.]